MAYRPDGGTVLPAEWGCGSALAGAEAGGYGPSPHLLTPAPGPGGELGFFLVLTVSPVGQFIRFFRLWSENALCSNPSSATSLLCDLKK